MYEIYINELFLRTLSFMQKLYSNLRKSCTIATNKASFRTIDQK